MKEFFAAIYDTWFGVFNQQYILIFRNLFDEGGYIMFGLCFIFIPLILWLFFYYVWNNPYGKFWHWLFWLIIISLLVAGTTWVIASHEIFGSSNQMLNDALTTPGSGYNDYAQSLPIKYAIINGFLTLVISFIYSLIMKQFSKIQIHLPF